MYFIAENNAKVDFKGYDKMQGLIALSDSTGWSAAAAAARTTKSTNI